MAEILFDAPVPPDTLTRYIEKYVPRPAENQLTGLVNVNYVADDKVRWGTITRKNCMAKYRAFDGNIVRFHRLEYDLKTTVDKIYAIEALPKFLGDRLLVGR